MNWRRTGCVVRTAIIAVLTCAALAVLAVAIATSPLADPGQTPLPSAISSETVISSGRVLENNRYSLWMHVRRSWLTVTRYSKQCLSCGQFPPSHAPGCFYNQGFVVDYQWYERVDKQLALPGVSWKSGLCANSQFTELRLSLWIAFAVLAAYPAAAFIRGPLRRYQRTRRGACVQCGYNLTGNVSGRCPECGTVTTEPKKGLAPS